MLNKSKRDLRIFSGKRLFSNKTLDHWMPNVIVCYFPLQILWDYIIIYVRKLLFGVLVASYWFAFGKESSNILMWMIEVMNILDFMWISNEIKTLLYLSKHCSVSCYPELCLTCFMSCYPEKCLTNMRNMTKGIYSFLCCVLLHRMLVV